MSADYDDIDLLQCDNCGRSFHISELVRCRKCGAVLCEECRKTHCCESESDNSIEYISHNNRNKIKSILKIILIITALLLVISIACIAISGINLYPHIIEDKSAVGYERIDCTFPFLDGMESITVTVPSSVYYGAKSEESHDISSSMIDSQEYYYYYTNDPLQEDMYKSILSQMDAIRQKLGLTSDEYVELITTYVQTITYDDNAPNIPRYPVETVIDMKGDCDETSMLLAGLLSRAGYDVVLLSFDYEEHMTVGINASGYNAYPDTGGYSIIETTIYSYIADNYDMTSIPVVIDVGDGELTYNTGYQVSEIRNWIDNVKIYIDSSNRNIDSTKSRMSYLSSQIDDYEAQLDYYDSQLDNLNNKYDLGWISYEDYSKMWDMYNIEYNSLYSTYSSLIDEYNILVRKSNSNVDLINDYVDVYNKAIKETYNRQYIYNLIQRYPI